MMTDSDVPKSVGREPSVPLPSPDSESASFAGQLYVPKLRVKHVIVWLALAVALIGLDYGMSTMETREIAILPHEAISVKLSWTARIVLLFSFPSIAACLVASGILIRSGCFRMFSRLQPGHWIVLVLGAGGLLRCIVRQFELRMVYHSSHGWMHALDATLWGETLAVAAMFAFAAICVRDAKQWKVLLVSGSAYALFWAIPLLTKVGVFRQSRSFTEVASAIVQVWRWSYPWWPAILVVIALAAVFIDWPRRATRDWVHWLGVSLWTLGNLATLCLYLCMPG
jgi:hypothetical protein